MVLSLNAVSQYSVEQVLPTSPGSAIVTNLDKGGHQTEIIDMNNDGHNDIVSWSGYDVYTRAFPQILINNGMGIFTPLENPAFAGRYFFDFSVGDYDNDGYKDVLATEYDGVNEVYGVKTFLNDGNGYLSEVIVEEPWFTNNQDASTLFADLNSDNIEDLIFVPEFNGEIKIYHGEGNSEFDFIEEITNPGFGTDNSKRAFLSDIDNDGHLDIVTDQKVFLNDGQGEFSEFLEATGVDPYIQAVGDIDGNGTKDLIIFNSWFDEDDNYNFSVSCQYVNPDGSPPPCMYEETSWGCCSDGVIGVFDLDQNGYNDILFTPNNAFYNLYAKVLYNMGNEGFEFAHACNELGYINGNYVASGDLTGDGEDEIIMGIKAKAYGLNENQVWEYLSGSELDEDNQGIDHIFDLDGDNDLDLIKLLQTNTLGLDDDTCFDYPPLKYFNDGTGSIQKEVLITDPVVLDFLDTYIESTPIDIDGDSDKDILIIRNDSISGVLVNDGSGNFTLDHVGVLENHFGTIQGVDLNIDGYDDLVLEDNSITVFLNNGSGELVPSSFFDTPWFIHAPVLIDQIDDDNYPDILFFEGTSATPTPPRLLINDGNGFFSESANVMTGMVSPAQKFLADFDNDGDLDLYSFSNSVPVLFENDGNGLYTAVSSNFDFLIPNADFTASKGHFNDDEYCDILFEGWVDDENVRKMYVGIGNGDFSFSFFQINELLPFQYVDRLFVFDANGDGIDDFAVHGTQSWFYPFMRFFLSQGILTNSDFPESKEANIYPNPADEFVMVSTENPLLVTFYDVQGRTVLQKEKQKRINISQLQNGVYLVQVKSLDGAVRFGKIVVQ